MMLRRLGLVVGALVCLSSLIFPCYCTSDVDASSLPSVDDQFCQSSSAEDLSTCSTNAVPKQDDWSRLYPNSPICQDDHVECSSWAKSGECGANPRYMLSTCRKSCRVCPRKPGQFDQLEDLGGIPQVIDRDRTQEVLETIRKTREYMDRVVFAPENLATYAKVVNLCQLQHEHCAYWATLGECESNKSYMRSHCAPVCQTCDLLHVENRCPVDPNATDAWYTGDLNRMFERIVQDYPQFSPKVWSRPRYAKGDHEFNSDYQLGPWVVTLEDFVSQEEANHLIELGAQSGYERSSDVGPLKPDGSFDPHVNSGRTSTNAWCQDACFTNETSQNIIKRIANLTQIDDVNSEYLQLLRYEPGQKYEIHHDFIPHQVRRQEGVRILTVYLYLSDVEEGGGTNFPDLDLTIMPKLGRVLIWPSVLNDRPNLADDRTDHQALPVVKGIKYGANAWFHQRDFKTPNANGCF